MPIWPPSLQQPFLALAPHAAVAAALCRAVRDGSFIGLTRLANICAVAGIAEARSAAIEAALNAGSLHGLFVRCGGGEWRPGVGPFAELALTLSAVTLYREQIHVDMNVVEVVLTPPGRPSQLGEQLRHRGWIEADLEHTESILRHLARAARNRFAVLSPFIDAVGAASVVALFRETAEGIRRVLVTRCQEGVVPPTLLAVMPELAALGVAVHNYWLPRAGGGYETFHAKAVLADTRLAYLGSANMTQASLSLSMELGAFLQGESTRTLASVVDAILSIAPTIGQKGLATPRL